MDGLTIEDLRKRHADYTAAREASQRQARETDMGYAYVLGELEQLIALVEQRQATTGDAAAGEREQLIALAEAPSPALIMEES